MADYLHRDTQGPCPDGYHVPTKGDWESLNSILQGWFADKGYWKVSEYLKLPLGTGWISVSSAEITSSGFSMYWTSTLGEKQAYVFNVEKLSSSTSSIRVAEYYTAIGTFIRPFKNIPVVPDGTWSTLYTSGNGGIYWNAGLGLISISGDGKTWHTIADKNLGATTVASYTGSTVSWSLSQCGYYYQWGNNNGFEYTYPLPYSSNQVDASGYGPGNYYNKSTYIKYIQNDDYGIWDSSHNASLWGGDTDRRPLPPANKYITKLYHLGKEYIFDERISTTGINVSPTSINLTKLNETAQITASVIPSNADDKKIIYTSNAPSIVSVSSTGLVKALGEGNATITVKSNDGGFSKSVSVVSKFGWQPGSNTVAYYPLEKDVLDYSGNNRNLTNIGITFTGGYGNFNGSSYGYINTSLVKTNNTISFWYRKDISGGSVAMDVFNNGINDTSTNSIYGRFGIRSDIYEIVQYAYGTTSHTGQINQVNYTYSGLLSGSWYHITFIKNGSVLQLYINGAWKASENISGTNSENSYFAIGRGYNGVYPLYGQLSNFILENKARTATEISEYYNQTKSKYGK